MTQLNFEPAARSPWVRRRTGLVICGVLVVVVVVLGLLRLTSSGSNGVAPVAPAIRYLGVYEPGSPQSYANVDRFARAVGRSPNLVTYYSFWYEPFKTSFAETAASHGATTIVQIEPNRSEERRVGKECQ